MGDSGHPPKAARPATYTWLMTDTNKLADAVDRARRIKVLIFDVDGVLTEGGITVHPLADGTSTEPKTFSAHDGMGMAIGKLGGLRIGVVTKRQSQAVAIRSRDLKLEFVYQNSAHKLDAIAEILKATNCTPDQLCYVGDDIVDLPVMRMCGLAIAPANARPEARAAAHWITPMLGGQGAGRDAIDFILGAQGSLERVIEQYLDASDPTARASDIGTGSM